MAKNVLHALREALGLSPKSSKRGSVSVRKTTKKAAKKTVKKAATKRKAVKKAVKKSSRKRR